jgi:hypothetical protein
MNSKRIFLPAIASLLILVMLVSSFSAATAQVVLVARALPTLQVKTIPEDDEVRQTGIIIIGLTPHMATWDKPVDNYCLNNPGACIKKEAQYKILVTFNGVPVNFNIACEFVKKEKSHPLQKPQFAQEVIKTVLTDESAGFVCKLRQGKPGVGVIDVYYVGVQQKQFIADYIMVVSVWQTFGRTTVYGVEMQDLCLLGWANDDNTMYITKPDGTKAFSWPDPLGPFVSCEEAAVLQRQNLGLPILYD